MQNAAAFIHLLRLSQSTDDVEEKLFALEAAWQLEPQLEVWPLNNPRDEFKGGILSDLAGAYLNRTSGQLADNLEKALAFFQEALEFRPRDKDPHDWAGTMSNIGTVLLERVRGDPRENAKRAIAAYEAAATVFSQESFPEKYAAISENLQKAIAAYNRGNDATHFMQLLKQIESELPEEQKIALLESAVGIESELTEWPLKEPRRLIRGALLHSLADAYQLSSYGVRAENMENSISTYTRALQTFTLTDFSHQWAQVQNDLALAYVGRIRGNRAENLEYAIAAHQAALTVRTKETLPVLWMQTQNNLANIYVDRIHGNCLENLERAILGYKAALSIATQEAFSEEWASINSHIAKATALYERGEAAIRFDQLFRHLERLQGANRQMEDVDEAVRILKTALELEPRLLSSPFGGPRSEVRGLILSCLGDTYRDSHQSDRPLNLGFAIAAYEAALPTFSRETSAKWWSQLQNSIAVCFAQRVDGDRANNLERAIQGFEVVLNVHTGGDSAVEWAKAQGNLAGAYIDRIHGERSENVELAIAAYQAALTVQNREATPEDWATTQNGLGEAYAARLRGDRADNQDSSIACHQAALTVFSPQKNHVKWALAQNNLAATYAERLNGVEADNLERSIAAYEAALTIRTREAFPQDWAKTQNNLGGVYARSIYGDAAGNLSRAFAAYNIALSVQRRDAFPLDWAATHHNLACAYFAATTMDRAESLNQAVDHFEAALTVYALETLPRNHLVSSRWLGRVHLERLDYQSATAAFKNARDAFSILFGQQLNETESRDLLSAAGSLFAEAAYVAAEMHDTNQALSILSEGKARLLEVALRQQGLEIVPEQAARLRDLRAAIRVASRFADAATGDEAARATKQLGLFRRELLNLMNGGQSSGTAVDNVLAQAELLVQDGAVLVAPIVTECGGKLLIAAAETGVLRITEHSLSQLNREQLRELLIGRPKKNERTGWLDAFNIQYLPRDQRDARYSEWLSAIEGIGQKLWSTIGAVLQQGLEARSIQPNARLIWLPTEALGILPIGLAQDGVGGCRLGDTYEIAFAPSLAALAYASRQVEEGDHPSLAVVANPTKDLSSTEVEARLVANHFGKLDCTVLERGRATPEAVLSALKERSYWHFACHGSFDWIDARRSTLLLAGKEPLTVGRLLDTDGLKRPRLVALSACETGLYEIRDNPDEFIGLPSTFLALGAAGVLSTLWQVDDRATALLIAKFYDLHLGQGLSPPTALKGAQSWLRDATTTELDDYERTATKNDPETCKMPVANAWAEGPEEDVRFAASRKSQSILRKARATKTRSLRARIFGQKAMQEAQPYAHPYYWGGFIYTGL